MLSPVGVDELASIFPARLRSTDRLLPSVERAVSSRRGACRSRFSQWQAYSESRPLPTLLCRCDAASANEVLLTRTSVHRKRFVVWRALACIAAALAAPAAALAQAATNPNLNAQLLVGARQG